MPFKKGQSGNPGGRKATTVNGVSITELAKEYGVEAIQTLAEIMRDKGAPAAARNKAMEALLDRGFGKPLQKAELTGADGKDLMPASPVDAAKELIAIYAQLEQAGALKVEK